MMAMIMKKSIFRDWIRSKIVIGLKERRGLRGWEYSHITDLMWSNVPAWLLLPSPAYMTQVIKKIKKSNSFTATVCMCALLHLRVCAQETVTDLSARERETKVSVEEREDEKYEVLVLSLFLAAAEWVRCESSGGARLWWGECTSRARSGKLVRLRQQRLNRDAGNRRTDGGQTDRQPQRERWLLFIGDLEDGREGGWKPMLFKTYSGTTRNTT